MLNWKTLRRSLLGESADIAVPPNIPVPAFPKALHDFCRMAEAPEPSPRALGKVIETDAGLSLEVVRYANSSAVGLREQVASPHQVITLLGIRRTRLFLLQTVLGRIAREARNELLDVEAFGQANLERAHLARELAVELGCNAEQAYSAGLIQDFLLPMLIQQNLEVYREYVETRQVEQTLVEYEQEVFGWDHAEAAARLLAGWDFPDAMVCSVHLHHRFRDLLGDPDQWRSEAGAAAVAGLIPGAFPQEPTGPRTLAMLDEQWPKCQLQSRTERIAYQVDQLIDHDALPALSARLGFEIETASEATSFG